jgi:glycine/D-amino acid oxidase-like deaminating enzyme
MDREAALIAEPALGPDVLGALVCPGDGHINPKKYVRALAEEV